MFKGLGQLGDMTKMMKQAQEMQGRLAEVQDGLDNIKVTGESGAGLVTVTATAKGDVVGLNIDPTIFSPDDKEVAEDLIIAAIKDAQVKAKAASKAEMSKMAEEMGMPPGMELPF